MTLLDCKSAIIGDFNFPKPVTSAVVVVVVRYCLSLFVNSFELPGRGGAKMG